MIRNLLFTCFFLVGCSSQKVVTVESENNKAIDNYFVQIVAFGIFDDPYISARGGGTDIKELYFLNKKANNDCYYKKKILSGDLLTCEKQFLVRNQIIVERSFYESVFHNDRLYCFGFYSGIRGKCYLWDKIPSNIPWSRK